MRALSSLVLTTTYVVTTILIWRSSSKVVEEQREARAQDRQPLITADLEVDGERHLAHFVLRNVGAGIARAVRFKIDPPFENPKKPQLGLTSDKPFVQRGVPIMVAGKEIRTLVGVFGDWGGSHRAQTPG